MLYQQMQHGSYQYDPRYNDQSSSYSSENVNNNMNQYPPPLVSEQPYPPPIVAEQPVINARQLVQNYDTNTLFNPLIPPTSRPAGYYFAPTVLNPLFNEPTRGPMDDFSYVGNLVKIHECDRSDDRDRDRYYESEERHNSHDNVNDNKSIIRLMGRQKYPNNDKYEYYVLVPDGVGFLKIDVHNHRHDEIYDHDEVYVPELNHKYKLHKNKSFFKQFY